MSTAGEIRGCTLHRPWPSAFLLPERTFPAPGAIMRPKRVENRPWYPKWACPTMSNGMAYARPGIYLALHAGKQDDLSALAAIWKLGWPDLHMGEPGQIVAVCRLARVLDLDALGPTHPLIAQHAPWASGPYCWEVDRVTELPEPVACKGAQGLWPLPPEVLARVRMQWAAATTRGE